MRSWFGAWRDWRRRRPGAAYRRVRARARRLSHTALCDYIDNAGTDMARAVYTLRKEAGARTALAEARRQHEMLWALLDELSDRQKADL